jgi:hypothetical protein
MISITRIEAAGATAGCARRLEGAAASARALTSLTYPNRFISITFSR